MRRLRLLTRTLIVLLGVGAASIALWRGLFSAPANALEDGDFGPVADFRLMDQDGRAVSLSDLKGRPWVADFIFTRCMGPCPVISKAMARLASSPSAGGARLVSFSVDPAHDRPEVLKDYAARFGADPARWFFLTGETSAMEGLVMGSFKAALQKNAGAPAGEAVTHSLSFVLVDKAGRIRGYFTAVDDAAMERLAGRLKSLS